jgi:hypothetical protein
MRRVALGWDFDEAIALLNIKGTQRDRCRDELIFICVHYKLEIEQQGQETPGRIEASVTKARMLARRARRTRDAQDRERACKQLDSLPTLIRWKHATGLPMGTGGAPLRNTVHRLQALADQWDKALVWKGRSPPRKLIEFIMAALGAANIKLPSPVDNRSKFLALMVRPREESKQVVEAPSRLRSRRAS